MRKVYSRMKSSGNFSEISCFGVVGNVELWTMKILLGSEADDCVLFLGFSLTASADCNWSSYISNMWITF